jgi:hypothetical protein
MDFCCIQLSSSREHGRASLLGLVQLLLKSTLLSFNIEYCSPSAGLTSHPSTSHSGYFGELLAYFVLYLLRYELTARIRGPFVNQEPTKVVLQRVQPLVQTQRVYQQALL